MMIFHMLHRISNSSMGFYGACKSKTGQLRTGNRLLGLKVKKIFFCFLQICKQNCNLLKFYSAKYSLYVRAYDWFLFYNSIQCSEFKFQPQASLPLSGHVRLLSLGHVRP